MGTTYLDMGACRKWGSLKEWVVSSPIGNIAISCCTNGLHTVGRVDHDETVHCDETKGVQLIETVAGDLPATYPVAQQCIKWLKKYFDSPQSIKSIPLPNICVASMDGPFQERVWLTLAQKTQLGQIVSYSELSELAGSNAKSSRAVGTAMAKNPIMLLVPCHRVVRKDGSLGNYSGGGPSVKKWLLDHESKAA